MARGYSNGPMVENTRACGAKAKSMARVHLAGLTVENIEGSIKMTRKMALVFSNKQMGKNTSETG
jgi:hypothetical protein